VRFDYGWRRRRAALLPIEQEYASPKLAAAETLVRTGDRFGLLLALIELVEDADTLTVRGQPDISVKLLTFRDHFRDIMGSPQYREFEAGTRNAGSLLQLVSEHLRRDLGLAYDLATLGPARNFSSRENYLQQWHVPRGDGEPGSARGGSRRRPAAVVHTGTEILPPCRIRARPQIQSDSTRWRVQFSSRTLCGGSASTTVTDVFANIPGLSSGSSITRRRRAR
jgi:hypothetical protein